MKPKPRRRPLSRDKMHGVVTPKQEKFIEFFLLTGNGQRSAIAAGYATARARIEASELLKNPKIKKHLERAKVILEQEYQATPERVVREIAMIAFTDPTEVIHISDNMVTIANTDDLSVAARRLVTEASQSITKEGGTLRIKLEGRIKALELLARILGLVKPDNPFQAFKPDPTRPLVAVPIYMPAQLEA